jgi:hypothetical protein
MIRPPTHRFRTQRCFVSDMAQLRLTPELARTRVRTSSGAGWPPGRPIISLTVSVPGANSGDAVAVDVIASRQQLGGRRWWWACPGCGRRCAILLRPAVGQRFKCRVCWHAVYLSDYENRQDVLARSGRLATSSGARLGDLHREWSRLTACRRKGVRRGRRVKKRARRILAKIFQQQLRVSEMRRRA